MSTPALEVAQLLTTRGLVVSAGSGRDAHYENMPDGEDVRDDVVVFTDRGTDPTSVADTDQVDRVLIRVRGNTQDRSVAVIRCRAITDALHGTANQPLPISGEWLVAMWATYTGSIGQDGQGRPVHVIQVRLQTMHPTALRTV